MRDGVVSLLYQFSLGKGGREVGKVGRREGGREKKGKGGREQLKSREEAVGVMGNEKKVGDDDNEKGCDGKAETARQTEIRREKQREGRRERREA